MRAEADGMDDAALVALVLEGERDAFGPLLLRHQSGVHRLCARLIGDPAEAHDVAQEAALQAFLGLRSLHDPSRFGAWLYAIAANLALMALRRRRPVSLDALTAGDSGSLRADALLAAAAAVPSPEDVRAAREVHDAIVAAIRELSGVNREVVVGYYVEGLSYAELAEQLGVPLSTVRGRLFKGRRQLRGSLAPTAREVLKPARPLPKVGRMEETAMVEVTVEQTYLGVGEGSEIHLVLLRPGESERLVPIWIGEAEAESIAMALRGRSTARPMTHDLAVRMLEAVGARVTRVRINRLAEETYYAEVVLTRDGAEIVVDSRPSDAIALAVRTEAPIQVAPEIVSAQSIDPEETPLDEVSDRARRKRAGAPDEQSDLPGESQAGQGE